jgi:hypothetical protein
MKLVKLTSMEAKMQMKVKEETRLEVSCSHPLMCSDDDIIDIIRLVTDTHKHYETQTSGQHNDIFNVCLLILQLIILTSNSYIYNFVSFL